MYFLLLRQVLLFFRLFTLPVPYRRRRRRRFQSETIASPAPNLLIKRCVESVTCLDMASTTYFNMI